jgi:hypothetical protein
MAFARTGDGVPVRLLVRLITVPAGVMIWPVDITYEPFACGPTVYVGNSVDGSAIAAELAPIKAETANDTMLDDLLVMNFLPTGLQTDKKFRIHSGHWHQWPAPILLEVRVVMMTVM